MSFVRKHLFASLVFFLLVFISFNSCFLKKTDKTINLSLADSLTVGEKWAVITEPYASFREDSDYSSLITGHARRGDILLIDGRKYATDPKTKKTTVWYKIQDGWIAESSIQIFDNKLKATKAVSELK